MENLLCTSRKMDLSDDLEEEDELLEAAIQLSIQESCKDVASLGRCDVHIRSCLLESWNKANILENIVITNYFFYPANIFSVEHQKILDAIYRGERFYACCKSIRFNKIIHLCIFHLVELHCKMKIIIYISKWKIISSGPTGDLFALQELSDYPAAFTEMDTKGWYPIHRAAVQQSVQVLEMVLYGELEYKVHCCSLSKGSVLLYNILINKIKKSILSNLNFRHNIASRFCFAVKIFPNKATESTVACLGCVYINSDTFKNGIFFPKWFPFTL